jgi:hypothetical protein
MHARQATRFSASRQAPDETFAACLIWVRPSGALTTGIILAKTFITVSGSGQAPCLPDSGEAVIRFAFNHRQDAASAVGEITGFIDALLDEGVHLDDAGLFCQPTAGPVRIVELWDGRVNAFVDLAVHFYDGAAFSGWLDESGVDEDDLVDVSVSPVTWAWSDEALRGAEALARLEAFFNADSKVDDYVIAIETEFEIVDAMLTKVDEVDANVTLPGCAVELDTDATLEDALTPTNEAMVTVDLFATFKLKY